MLIVTIGERKRFYLRCVFAYSLLNGYSEKMLFNILCNNMLSLKFVYTRMYSFELDINEYDDPQNW